MLLLAPRVLLQQQLPPTRSSSPCCSIPTGNKGSLSPCCCCNCSMRAVTIKRIVPTIHRSFPGPQKYNDRSISRSITIKVQSSYPNIARMTIWPHPKVGSPICFCGSLFAPSSPPVLLFSFRLCPKQQHVNGRVLTTSAIIW
jgi:hypothetical protein